jgi:Protein involved in cellulose biosynthesis (CelD)
MSDQFTYKIFRKFDQELGNLWISFEKNKNYFFYQKIEYIKNLINLSESSDILIVVIYNKGLPIILCPLEIKKLYGIKILQWIGTTESDYCAPILSNSSTLNEITFNKLWKRILGEIRYYDLILFKKQPEYVEKNLNPFVSYLKNFFQSKVYQINLNGDMEDYLKSIKNKKFLSEFKRTEKKLFLDFEVKFEHFTKYQNDLKPSDFIKQKKLTLEKKKIKNDLNEKLMNLHDRTYKKLKENYMLTVLKINGKKCS